MVDIMYITEINLFIEGEKDRVVTFPDFNEKDFDIINGEETNEYRRFIYIRKKVKFR